MIKKLVVQEFEVQESSEQLPAGDKFSYFVDPETGKYYRPVDGFTVTGEDLSDRFIEVLSANDNLDCH